MSLEDKLNWAHRVKTQKIFNGDLNAAEQNVMEQYSVPTFSS